MKAGKLVSGGKMLPWWRDNIEPHNSTLSLKKLSRSIKYLIKIVTRMPPSRYISGHFRWVKLISIGSYHVLKISNLYYIKYINYVSDYLCFIFAEFGQDIIYNESFVAASEEYFRSIGISILIFVAAFSQSNYKLITMVIFTKLLN